MLQITHIGYRWAVATDRRYLGLMPISPISDIRYHYRSDTNNSAIISVGHTDTKFYYQCSVLIDSTDGATLLSEVLAQTN